MKNQNFLRKIKFQNQISLVEPNSEIKDSYLSDSESYFSSAKILFNLNKLKETTQLVYFSVYYSLLAILFRIGIKSENHLASVILLKEIFDIDNEFILSLRKKRVATYYPNFEIEKKILEKTINDAEEFNDKILNFLSNLSQEKINFYKNKFKNLLK